MADDGTFDYVVCGAGSAGCVLANRLSANPSNRVLLIEAGGWDNHPIIRVPKGFYFTLGNEKRSWLYRTQPYGPTGNVELWARGRIIGGSSSINGMVYNRGSKPDWDAIVELGNPGWGWDDILPLYMEMEDHTLGPSETRGVGGPLGVSVTDDREEVCEAAIAAGQTLGWNRLADTNETDEERIGYTPSTIKNGLRQSSSRAFLRPVLKRPNLTIMTQTKVGKLLFDGKRASGVRVMKKGQAYDFRAGREVIVSLGALESPPLLERSGIGRADVLSAAGVPLLVESPRVGEGMREHRMITFQHRLSKDLGYNKMLSSTFRQMVTGAKYLKTRSGPVAIGGYDLIADFKSRPDVDRPDSQCFITPLSIGPAEFASGMRPERLPGLMSCCFALRPDSEGSIHISSDDPSVPTAIEPNYLSTDHDVSISLDVFTKMRELWAASPLADYIQAETAPGIAVQHPDDVLRQFQINGGPAYHSLGTCAMGPGDEDPVDAELNVRGVEALRVVDASVFPTMISGNCNGPTMAVALKAAKLITATDA